MNNKSTVGILLAAGCSVCLFLFGANAAAGFDPPAFDSPPSLSVCTRCAEDPTCRVVGETHMLEWRSPTPKKIIVVCIHGLGLCARAYKPLASDFSAAGIDGYGLNVRGFGPDRDKPDRAQLNCLQTVSDIQKLLLSIHQEKPDYKVFVVGESMGGALALRVAAENPELIDGVICSAPAWKILKVRPTAVKGVVELLLFPAASPGPAGRGVIRQATSDPDLTQHWLNDPSHKLKLSLKEATAFLKFTAKTDEYARRVQKPIIVVQGLEDHLVSPAGVAKLFADIPSLKKTLLIDVQGEHLLLEEDRFSQALSDRLIRWILTDSNSQEAGPTVELIDAQQPLSATAKQRLARLQRLAKGRDTAEASYGNEAQAVLERQAAAWNRGDLNDFMKGYLQSSETSYISGDTQVFGYQALKQRYEKKYGNAPDTMGKLDFSELKFFPIGEDSILCIGHWHLVREGKPDVRGVFSLVFVRQENDWKIMHDHTTVN